MSDELKYRSDVCSGCQDIVRQLELQVGEQQKKYSDLLQSHHSLCCKVEERNEQLKELNRFNDEYLKALEKIAEFGCMKCKGWDCPSCVAKKALAQKRKCEHPTASWGGAERGNVCGTCGQEHV